MQLTGRTQARPSVWPQGSAECREVFVLQAKIKVPKALLKRSKVIATVWYLPDTPLNMMFADILQTTVLQGVIVLFLPYLVG